MSVSDPEASSGLDVASVDGSRSRAHNESEKQGLDGSICSRSNVALVGTVVLVMALGYLITFLLLQTFVLGDGTYLKIPVCEKGCQDNGDCKSGHCLTEIGGYCANSDGKMPDFCSCTWLTQCASGRCEGLEERQDGKKVFCPDAGPEMCQCEPRLAPCEPCNEHNDCRVGWCSRLIDGGNGRCHCKPNVPCPDSGHCPSFPQLDTCDKGCHDDGDCKSGRCLTEIGGYCANSDGKMPLFCPCTWLTQCASGRCEGLEERQDGKKMFCPDAGPEMCRCEPRLAPCEPCNEHNDCKAGRCSRLTGGGNGSCFCNATVPCPESRHCAAL